MIEKIMDAGSIFQEKQKKMLKPGKKQPKIRIQ